MLVPDPSPQPAERGVFRSDAATGDVAFIVVDRHGQRRLRLELAEDDFERVRAPVMTALHEFLDLVDASTLRIVS